MKIYYFGGTIDMVDMLYENGFDGNLFLAGIKNDDFVKIGRHMDISKNFKYMVAIRAYLISPQYLSMICSSINEISNNKIEINLLSGWTKEEEKHVGGIMGDVNDLSPQIDKSNYMIEFLEVMNNMKTLHKPKTYVSCTNEFTFAAAKKHKEHVILPYSRYKTGQYDIEKSKTIISIGPIFKDYEDNRNIDINDAPYDSEFFTKESFASFLDKLDNDGFDGILLYGWPIETENARIIEFVKEYKNKN
jgi:hypothetical protein